MRRDIPFKVGQHVRLKRGWTKMTVIGFSYDGYVIASYLTDIPDDDYQDPHMAYSTQSRHYSSFTEWDGHPQARTLDQKMPRNTNQPSTRYQTNYGHTGIQVGSTTDGKPILEFASGNIGAYDPSLLKEVLADGFEAVDMMTNRGYIYELSKGHVIVGDILVSERNVLLRVTKPILATPGKHATFVGHRLVRESM